MTRTTLTTAVASLNLMEAIVRVSSGGGRSLDRVSQTRQGTAGQSPNLGLSLLVLGLVVSPGLGVGHGSRGGLDASLRLSGVAGHGDPFLGLGEAVVVLVPSLAGSVARAAGDVSVGRALDVLLGVAVGQGNTIASLDLVHGSVGDGGIGSRLGGSGFGLDSGGLVVGDLEGQRGLLDLRNLEGLA